MALMPSRPPLRERRARHVAIAERMAAAGDLLVGLVALAREQHDVAGARLVHRGEDRHLAVLDRLGRAAGNAREHLLDDRVRILAARIVAGDDHVVGEPRGRRAHERALAGIALAAAAEHADQARARAPPRAQRLERLLERIRRVRVVDDHEREPLPPPTRSSRPGTGRSALTAASAASNAIARREQRRRAPRAGWRR